MDRTDEQTASLSWTKWITALTKQLQSPKYQSSSYQLHCINIYNTVTVDMFIFKDFCGYLEAQTQQLKHSLEAHPAGTLQYFSWNYQAM